MSESNMSEYDRIKGVAKAMQNVLKDFNFLRELFRECVEGTDPDFVPELKLMYDGTYDKCYDVMAPYCLPGGAFCKVPPVKEREVECGVFSEAVENLENEFSDCLIGLLEQSTDRKSSLNVLCRSWIDRGHKLWIELTYGDYTPLDWVSYGFGPEEAKRWRSAGIVNPFKASRLEDNEFSYPGAFAVVVSKQFCASISQPFEGKTLGQMYNDGLLSLSQVYRFFREEDKKKGDEVMAEKSCEGDTNDRAIKTHILKTIDPFFLDVWNDVKKFDLRKDDRDYQVRDFLILYLYDPNSPTDFMDSDFVFCRITYILSDTTMGLKDGYAILGLEIIYKRKH